MWPSPHTTAHRLNTDDGWCIYRTACSGLQPCKTSKWQTCVIKRRHPCKVFRFSFQNLNYVWESSRIWQREWVNYCEVVKTALNTTLSHFQNWRDPASEDNNALSQEVMGWRTPLVQDCWRPGPVAWIPLWILKCSQVWRASTRACLAWGYIDTEAQYTSAFTLPPPCKLFWHMSLPHTHTFPRAHTSPSLTHTIVA